MEQTDVCIIGAGPGGAGAALKLSYLGKSCVLLDKAKFPRDKICGDAISGKITMLLGRLDTDILDRFRDKAEENIDVWGIRFVPPNRRVIDLPFTVGYDKTKTKAPGYVSKRMNFDHFLIDEVKKRSNIDFREEVEITNYTKTSTGWEIKDKKGKVHIHTKLLLVADGAHSRFSRQIAGHEKENAHHAAAVRAYYDGVTGFHDDNYIELHFLSELNPGYFWIFPLPNGKANVGLGMRSDFVQKRRLNLRKMMLEVIENNPEIKERFANAQLIDKIVGYGLPLGSKRRSLSGDHYMLLGDAGHLIDPLTGEGIGNAFYSGFIAAEQAIQCLKDDRYDAEYLLDYDKRSDRVLRVEMRLSYKIQRVMQYEWLVNFLTSIISKNPKMVDVICRMYTDFDLRKKIISPVFWLKMAFKKRS